MSARKYDTNGWFEIQRNPLSKVGVYDYSGAQIGAPPADATKIFKVYRPADELSDPDAMASFRLVPIIDNHTMLGEGFTPTDDRPPAGVVGENLTFEDDTLFGNIKVFSKGLAQNIKSGKTEISLGYRCRYDFTPGVFNGQKYDAIQRTLRGNHMAVVDEGRMGPEVAILDHMIFTVDAKESTPVMDEELKALLASIVARLEKLEGGKPAEVPAVVPPAGDADPAKLAADKAAADKAAADKAIADKAAADAEAGTPAEQEPPASMDAALKTIAALTGRLAAVETRPAMDEAAVFQAAARKSDLVAKLAPHIGTFDHAAMTVAQVAKYGVDKLEIKGVAVGSELPALDAYLQAKTTPTPIVTAQDAAHKPLAGAIKSYATGA